MFFLCAHYYYLQPNGIYVFHGFGHVCVNVMFIVTGHGKGGERKLCDGFVRQKFYIVNLFIAFMLIQMYVFVFVCVFSFWAIKIGAFVIPNEHSSKWERKLFRMNKHQQVDYSWSDYFSSVWPICVSFFFFCENYLRFFFYDFIIFVNMMELYWNCCHSISIRFFVHLSDGCLSFSSLYSLR